MSPKETQIAEALNRVSSRLDQISSGAVTPYTAVTRSSCGSYGIRLELVKVEHHCRKCLGTGDLPDIPIGRYVKCRDCGATGVAPEFQYLYNDETLGRWRKPSE